MDETDLRLIQLLVHDPRASYRELADRLQLTVQAVHRRIQLLLESKVLVGFTATLSARYLEAVPVTLYGRSSKTREEVIAALDRSEMASGVLFGSGGVVVISGLLRRASELEAFVDLVREGAGVADPLVGLESEPSRGRTATAATEPLTSLDRRIVAALAGDARRPAAEVAKELGVTAATVSRRLDRLIAIGAVEFVTMLHPGFSGDVVAIVHLYLNEGADRQALIARLRAKLGPAAEYYRTFSNLPAYITLVAWTRSLRELEVLTDEVARDPDVRRVVPDIIFTGWYHPTWRDRLVAEGVG